MIERLEENSLEFDTLEKLFTDAFTQEKVKFDILNNSFTHYYMYKENNEVVAFINYV